MAAGEIVKRVQDFLGTELPDHVQGRLEDKSIMAEANQQEIMEAIDFTPPFLRIEKIVIFKGEKDSVIQSRSLCTGIMTQDDTRGHYNNTIFLAFCGRLMGQAASSHLGILFPNTAPQVVKVKDIEPIFDPDNTVWKPNKKGSVFIVETIVLKKKLQVAVVNSRISFGNNVFGIADDAMLVLTPKGSINAAKELPA